MKTTVAMMNAPAQMSPGNYIRVAYADATAPVIPTLDVEASRSGDSFEIHMRWPCATPMDSTQGSTDLFVDGAAILVPSHANAQWLTMGSPEAPVEGALWRADKNELIRIGAQGLGSVVRQAAPANWRIKSSHANGVYTLQWLFPKWDSLVQHGKCGFAVWVGSQRQRGGLKSVSTDWIALA